MRSSALRPSVRRLGALALAVLTGAALSTLAAVSANADANATVTGTVTDAATGAPLSGINVLLDLPGGSGVQWVQTDAAGHYAFASLSPATYAVEFRGDDTHVGQWWSHAASLATATPVRVDAGATVADVDAALAAAATVSGAATFEGAPAAYEGVSLVRPDGSYAGYAQADASGRFTVSGVAAGSYTAVFSSNQFGSGPHWTQQWWRDADTAAEATYFPVGSGAAVTGIDATLHPGATITGTVTGAAGATIAPYSTVVALNRSNEQQGGSSIAADGSYSIDGLAAGDYTLHFVPGFSGGTAASTYWGGAPTASTATYFPVPARSTLSGYDLTPAAAAVITGKVTSSTGAAPEGAFVQAFAADNPKLGVQGTFVQSDGSYSLAGLAAGSYLVFFYDGQPDTDVSQWWHGAASAATATPITVSAGGSVTGINAALTAGGSMTGTIRARLSSGALVVPQNPQVDVRDASGASVDIGAEAVDPDGTWHASNLRPGTYTVHISPERATTDFGSIWYRSGSSQATATTVTVRAGATRSGLDVILPSTDLRVGQVTVGGTPKVGRTLSARTPGWGPAPVTFAYQWLRSGAAIDGATASSYAPTNADAASTLSVRVTATKSGYTTEAVTSAPTAAVSGGRLTTSAPTIRGTARVGSTLTADPGPWGPGTVSFAYQWKRNGTPVSGATQASYTLVGDDAGARMTVTVTGSAPGFDSATRTSAATARVGRA